LAIDKGRWSTPSPSRFTSGEVTLPIAQEAGWVPGPIWTGSENLAPTEIRSPDRLVRSLVAVPTELSRLSVVIKQTTLQFVII